MALIRRLLKAPTAPGKLSNAVMNRLDRLEQDRKSAFRPRRALFT